MNRKTFWILFSIAALLRLALIWRAPLWYDENFTLILARLPFDKMLQATAGDVHPPLWYIVEWMLFHALPFLPAWAIRIPALVFSLAAFWMFAELVIVLQLTERLKTTALLLMAIMPMQLWYAQEGRMYAMLEFLVLFALYAGLTRRWTWFTVAAVALVYTQNYGMIYCGVIAFVLVALDWSMARRVAIAGAITIALYAPWAFIVSKQMTEIQGRYWIMDYSAGAVLGAIYKQFWVSAMLPPGTIVSYVVTFAVLLIGLYYVLANKSLDAPGVFIVTSMAVWPVGIAWIISALWQPLLLFRPLIGISPFLYIIAAAPLAAVDLKPSAKIYAACFVIPVWMFGTAGYYLNIAQMKGEGATSPLLATLDTVRAQWQPGDVIYYTDDGPMINLMPYIGDDMPQIKMPACEERVGYAPVLGSLSDTTRNALGIIIATIDHVPHTRAWVFAPRSPLHPQCYEEQIKDIAPLGAQLITVDDSEFITSGVWLVTAD